MQLPHALKSVQQATIRDVVPRDSLEASSLTTELLWLRALLHLCCLLLQGIAHSSRRFDRGEGRVRYTCYTCKKPRLMNFIRVSEYHECDCTE
eukprot:391786-Amphidinium_carterae.3